SVNPRKKLPMSLSEKVSGPLDSFHGIRTYGANGGAQVPFRTDSMCWRIMVGGLLLSAVGCGRTNLAPVSGRITRDNKPLTHATVIFQPLSGEKNPGPGSAGKTDEKGQYTLQLMTKNVQGAVLGKHKVSITAYEGGSEIPSSGSRPVFRKALVPLKYNAETELTFEVPPGGSTSADFNLKSVAE